MTIKLDDTIVCEVVTQAVEGGVTYALIRPDGRTEIYARRSYLTDGIASLLRKAVYKRLARGDKSKAAGS